MVRRRKVGYCATSLVVGMVLCSSFALAQKQGKGEVADKDLQRQLDNMIFKMHTLKLGFELPGASVDMVTKGMAGLPRELWEYLYLTHGSQAFILQQLNDLRHHVRIMDGPTALRYVRLITSPDTLYLWKYKQIAAEVTEASAAVNLPNYGLQNEPIISSPVIAEPTKGGFKTTFWLYDRRTRTMDLHAISQSDDPTRKARTMNPPDLSILGDGKKGIVTHKAYVAGKFSPPSVSPVKRGFQITRWLLVGDRSGESVQQVQEFVGTDGEYRRTVLKTISPPPFLPDINFTLHRYLE